MPGLRHSSYRFGPYRLDAEGGILFKEDKPVPLPLKAVETLRILVESGGRTVRREELMAQVWPGTFVEEANLTVTISLLRKILGDSREGSQYIETVPKRGYRFVAPVDTERAADGMAELELQPQPVVHAAESRRRRGRWVVAAGGSAILAGSLFFLLRSSPPAPKVLRTVQLTHTGRVDVGPNFATDGSRIYFTQRQGGHWGLYQVPAAGGQPVPIQTPFPNTVLYDISPDRSALLVAAFAGSLTPPVWILPLVGGTPRRVGNTVAQDAAWAPDGQRIVYTRESELYIVNRDGTGHQKLATGGGILWRPRFSPDGRVVRFTDLSGESSSLWEVGAGGAGLQRLFGPPANPGEEQGESDGVWTPDARFFLFRSVTRSSGGSYRTALSALREQRGLTRRNLDRPVQFYVSPLLLFGPMVSHDSRKLFVIGKQERRELARYDAKAQAFVPYLLGMSAAWLDFSNDGQWITYVSLPDRVLWRSRADGSERFQLTYPPIQPFYPRWTPDGRRIAFMGLTPGSKQRGIYVISRDGGSPEAVIAGQCDNPTWSPDGNSLLFTRGAEEGAGGPKPQVFLFRFDTRQITAIPGSEGFGGPNWSPDGRYALAENDTNQLMIFDFQSRRWQDLAHGVAICHAYWSRDSRTVYFQDCFGGATQPVFRVGIRDRKAERITPADPFLPTDVVAYGLTGVTPNGSPLATLIRNNSDIYELELEIP